MVRNVFRRVTLAAACALIFGGAFAVRAQQDSAAPADSSKLERTHLKVIARTRTLSTNAIELPLWKEWIPSASDGRITGDISPLSDMALDDAEMLRLLKLGIMDVANFDISKIAADEPAMEGCDLAGLTLTLEQARAACNAWRPTMERILAERWNAKLLMIGVDAPQVIWCRRPIEGLASLKGLKVRVINKSQTDFLEGVGADPIYIVWAEVIPAMQSGVFDCAATGTLSANSAGLPEVTTHIFPMKMGWSANVAAINIDSWNRLKPDVKAFLLGEYSKYEDKFWELGREMLAQGDRCNFNRPPCTMGRLAKLTEVPVKETESSQHREIMEKTVLRKFGERCGRACTLEWNGTIGTVLGLSAPVPK